MDQQSKKLDLSKIPFSEILDGLAINGSYVLAGSDISKVTNNEACSLSLSLNAADNLVVIDGLIEYFGEFDCGRCLKSFKQKISNRISTEAECVDAFFDLESILEEELLSDIAITSLCNDSCKGLCDKCGADLNLKMCDCVH